MVQHFAYNLGKMLRMCRDAGVPVILVEPASNLKDFSPFKSEHGSSLDTAARARVEETLVDAAHYINRREHEKALNLLATCTEVDPMYVMAHYLTGKALLGLG